VPVSLLNVFFVFSMYYACAHMLKVMIFLYHW